MATVNVQLRRVHLPTGMSRMLGDSVFARAHAARAATLADISMPDM